MGGVDHINVARSVPAAWGRCSYFVTAAPREAAAKPKEHHDRRLDPPQHRPRTSDRGRQTAGRAGAIVVGALGPATPAHADAGGPWVVIYYSPVNGIHGWANNRNTFQDADYAALANCQRFGGDGNCVVGAFSHNQCAAVAADSQVGDWSKFAGSAGADLQGAEGAAVHANGGGQIVLSRCATGDEGTGT